MKRCILCLQELPIFQGLDRNQFANVCFSTTKKRLDKGEFLFYQGQRANTIYLVKSGKLKLIQATEGGREIILDVIGPGEVLGETSLFHEQEQLFSAVALEETNLCCFSRQQFEKLIQQDTSLAVRIISYLSQKLYETMRQVGEVATQSVKEKILRLLFRLAGEYGREITSGTVIEVEVTQQELANMVGASRVMVAQVLKELKEVGVVDREGKYYVLKNDPCLSKHFS
ncbi:MAG: Crp/Fnr family transcriptional regulator [Thermoanaerobacteraceae bacterium]|nr:Crp/Fnr family transcriptional regulator [Thermoanaerobacteraceae bacterium]